MLGASLSAEPDSTRFYALSSGAAGIWIIGALGSGPLHLGRVQSSDGTARRAVIEPIAIGAAAFGAFFGAALVARRVPVLNAAISSVLQYAQRGSGPMVLATTLANGLGEELFFRGAVYAAAGTKHPVAVSTAIYTLAATTTRNPALIAASGVMGTLFARQRRSSNGILAPTLTHITWSTLMLRFLAPLFRAAAPMQGPARSPHARPPASSG